jgi:hypothetical protein
MHFVPGAGSHWGSIQQGMQSSGVVGAQSKSPVKEHSHLARTASVDEEESDAREADATATAIASGGGRAEGQLGEKRQSDQLEEMSVSPPPAKEGLPIRR